MSSLTLELDPRSPIPLYHQIAEALRYRIATGAIPAGDTLPPLREAARLWSVNLHTVRSAYAALAEAGIVETRAPSGTLVLPESGGGAGRSGGHAAGGHAAGRTAASGAAGGRPDGRPGGDPRGARSRADSARHVIEEARARHGLSLDGLVRLLGGRGAPAERAASAAVHVVECSMSQSADLARQIGERWRVRAVPWPTDRPEPPRAHPVVATYFHYNDLRLRWPDRFPEIRFLAISPDPGLVGRLTPSAPRGRSARRSPVTALLLERDEPMLRNIAADLTQILHQGRIRLETRLIRKPSMILDGVGPRQPVLVSPRVWGELPESLREDPRVHEVRYVFQPADLEALGGEFGWPTRREE
jgi:regulatory GntR family protein